MSANNTYLAVFLGSKTSPRRAAWDALSEGERRAKEQEGIAALEGVGREASGGDCQHGQTAGKDQEGHATWIDDTSNHMSAFTVCARIRTRPPRNSSTSIRTLPFSGNGVEIMPVWPISGG